MDLQNQGHQHPLPEVVHRSLGVSREQQPQALGVPCAGDEAEQLCF